jgi:nicotinic acid phosphoribosyltransferase
LGFASIGKSTALREYAERYSPTLGKLYIADTDTYIVDNFLKDCYRALKKGGKIYIQCPDLELHMDKHR